MLLTLVCYLHKQLFSIDKWDQEGGRIQDMIRSFRISEDSFGITEHLGQVDHFFQTVATPGVPETA
jgi:hypothetical protein